ncbi:MAG TPA: GGDEF domain-containing protein [Candidatus Angelobacter sp.]|nr:GGDEF domain-containing protein [Candidatus Angelobacter sp.]
MISLKKYLDLKLEAQKLTATPKRGVLEVAMQSYRSALLNMGKSGYRACPAYGASLQQSLTDLEKKLAGECSSGVLQQTSREVGEQLSQWGDRTAEHLRGKTQEVKDLLIMLAGTAESLGERDQRYASQLQQFTTRLRAVADLEDLTQVRSSLMQTAGELKTCVDQMEQDSQQAIAQLESRVSNYETKLKETEDLALRDPLTGLPNRLQLERRMEWRIENHQPFCVAFLDLNQFKQINDRYGHPAGDDLLKQFAGEVRSNLRPVDLVGRWGGDEFVVVLDCDLAAANTLMDRVRKWAFGDYTLAETRGKEKTRVQVSASIGTAEWIAGESAQQLVDRADHAMYQDKLHPKPSSSGSHNPGIALVGS